jgi:hypothetical protein
MKISKSENFLLELDDVEVETLKSLMSQVGNLISENNSADDVLKRLFPRVYSDIESEIDFDQFARTDVSRRMMDGLDSWNQKISKRTVIELSEFDGFLKAINLLRLAAGERLQIKQPGDVDQRDEPLAMLYHWLGWIQSEMIEQLS